MENISYITNSVSRYCSEMIRTYIARQVANEYLGDTEHNEEDVEKNVENTEFEEEKIQECDNEDKETQIEEKEQHQEDDEKEDDKNIVLPAGNYIIVYFGKDNMDKPLRTQVIQSSRP
jgi:hypothetical protein